MRHLTSLIAVFALISPAHVSAQRGNIAPGRQIRLTVPSLSGELITGTMVMSDANRILLRPHSPAMFWDDTLLVRASDIGLVEVNQGPPSRWPRTLGYSGLGLVAGALGGALIWPILSSSSCTPNAVAAERGSGCIENLLFDSSKRRDGALIFGAVGALFGAIAGYLSSAPDWTVVDGDRINVTVTPRPHRVSLQSVIRF